MANTLGKNLHLCFSKCKRPEVTQSPRTSFAGSDHDTTSILVKNFNSLYDLTSDSTSKSTSLSSDDFSSSDSEDLETTVPDFATIYASERFFFSSPGRSNSIVESLDSLPECPLPSEETKKLLMNGGIPISTYSPDPYTDFRRSMEEMVEARELLDVRADWDYLQELLLCYLNLNPKHTHKFIIGAFSDLLLSLMASPTESDGSSNLSSSDVSSGRSTVSRRLCNMSIS
ncbi:transcription repressor OFP12-like [Telopea speciosissima]|uniref:transcription repressor OFP12-like n=1 Tax=Telopea speciosissima TaxID=54955 RepID=UPI001CC59FB3|nr:transcription repressor OFP12-like [Telopea speciosissima]XP_043697228.1 transcription repressor OFP12-like [Telopea speciosissima]